MGYIADTEKVLFLFLRADIIGNTTRERENEKKSGGRQTKRLYIDFK